MKKHNVLILSTVLVLGLSGCATDNYSSRENVGMVGGAVVGGVLGSQIGSGSGRTAATIGGAALGGLVGREVGNRSGD